MTIEAINTEQDYKQAIQRFEELFDAPANSIEGDEAEILSILIEKYEDEYYPISAPVPNEDMQFLNSNSKDVQFQDK